MKLISASVVLYKTPKNQIETIVSSVVNSNCVSKLYIIDNNSTQENKEYFEKFDFVEYFPHENTGYGSSHNIALKKAIDSKFDYHVILNPDIIFKKDVLTSLSEYMTKNDDVVYILPKVVYPNGENQYLCRHLPKPIDLFSRRFFSNTKFMEKIDNNYSLKFFSYEKIINPPCLSGCFMFLRLKTLNDNNLYFDDRFFMYFEDFDLIRRLHKYGKTIYYPEYTIIHAHARASHSSKKMFLVFIKSLCQYFNKWGWFFDKERKLWNRQVDIEIIEVDNK